MYIEYIVNIHHNHKISKTKKDVWKAFDEIQHPFMTKTLNNQE